MRLDFLLHPAAPYAALVLGLALCLLLFLSLKRDLRVADERWRRKLEDVEAALQTKTDALDERWKELSHISSLMVAPEPPRSGLNLTKRSQALQMFRRGESPEAIAAALSLPSNEVELLIKVQRITLSGLTAPAARAAGS